MKKTYFALFFTTRLYILLGSNAMLFVLAYFFPVLYTLALIMVGALGFLLLLDLLSLFATGPDPLTISREMAQRFSNGDDNIVTVKLGNRYRFPVTVTILDELPFQFQLRDFCKMTVLKPGEQRSVEYMLRPVERGEYVFGDTNCFVRTPLGLVQRRIAAEGEEIVKVYPSFLQMRNYEFYCIDDRMGDIGVHKK